ncbi:MAG TPA: S53 family peptidase [Mycobacteriales bacterium]|nr:S53 family peptidase [Mycobacteriales bacterium]
MQRWTIGARLAVATTIVAATGAAITPGLAHASGPATGVTVFLKAPNTAALQRLADATGLTHAQRVRALTALLPTAAERAQAIAALRDAGLTVTGQSAWSVSASAPSSEVTAAFGAHPIAHAHPTAAEEAAATGPYLSMPAALQNVATAAFPTTAGPAAYHPADDSCDNCLGGADFRNAYTAPDVTPSSGLDSAATLTIATIQLAGWNPGDLTNWANTPGNVVGPTYNAAQDLTMVPVDQASVPTPQKGDTSDEEVDLDQEALYGTDPYAHQRPYFAPNTNAGIADAYSQIVDDVLQDNHAYQGGDPHIVAVSSSWGICEADNGMQDIRVMEPILESVVAAGVTVFSSSGDNGIYDSSADPDEADCNGLTANVNYPASSPAVVAVGGTNLLPVGTSSPNVGNNWAEQAWTCTSKASCAFGDGSGGGVSDVFTKPAYQNKITNAPFASVRMRMVPDISADADPATGFRIYTTDPTDTANNGPNYFQFGGTSLASPASAALFTDMLAAHGSTSGIGDIHQGLYNAYAANVGAFRDITQGSNGATADAGADPSVNAGVGYDTVTGLGSPLWSAVSSYVFAARPVLPPTSVGSLSLTHPTSASQPNQVTATWTSTKSASGIALAGAAVTIHRDGQSQPVYTNPTAPANGSFAFTGVPGATYQISVISSDVTGAKSKEADSSLSVPIDDTAFKLSGSWRRVRSDDTYAGSMVTSAHKSSYATATAAGATYGLIVPVGPSYGLLRVSWNGFNLLTINEYARTPGTKVVDIFDSGRRQTRTFKFTVLDRTAVASPSTSGNVGIDGLLAIY